MSSRQGSGCLSPRLDRVVAPRLGSLAAGCGSSGLQSLVRISAATGLFEPTIPRAPRRLFSICLAYFEASRSLAPVFRICCSGLRYLCGDCGYDCDRLLLYYIMYIISLRQWILIFFNFNFNIGFSSISSTKSLTEGVKLSIVNMSDLTIDYL